MMTDTIADMLIRIKNAYLANKDQVQLPASKKLEAVANVLREAGYLSEVKVVTNDKNQRNLELSLLYSGVTPALTDVKRVSKPGCRVYVTVGEIPAVLHGYGLAILSTSEGILSGAAAKQKGVGGELLAEVW
ncbi:30S ribosomal protein S8 [bacterium]|nr:30S ribosomal protein S8 [bacterium]